MAAKPKAPPKPKGRPSAFTEALAFAICERIAIGQSLRKICEDEHMPSQSMVFRWLADDEMVAFREQYARAREMQADTFVDEIVDIADTPMIGEKRKTDSEGKDEVTTGDMIEHRRLMVETRKWAAGKLRPKKYGDKIEVDGTMTHGVDASVTALMEAVNGKTRTV